MEKAKAIFNNRGWLYVVVVLVLFFVGYKVFVSKEWTFSVEDEAKLLKLQEEKKELEDALIVFRKKNDSLAKVSDARYKRWNSSRIDFFNLKKKYDEERRINANMSMDDHVRKLSEWLNSKEY
jgi:hypothetical protein